jgi:tRNA(Met) cytidine acetyltransferase
MNNNNNHRQVIRLKGPLLWCYEQCQKIIEQSKVPFFWLGESPDKITSTYYRQILGQEISLLIINAYQSFDANLFAASEGTLKGGGTLILLCPSKIDEQDNFYTYIDEQFNQASFLTIQPNDNLPVLSFNHLNQPTHLHLTQQTTAINAVIKTVTGHRRRPLVLTANRGRGKSAALGIAAKQLIEQGYQQILVCAPNKEATTTLFKHAGDSVKIRFIAPDLLCKEKPNCDLLLIDEAAAIPVPILEEMSKHYSRLVFATTLHGYEGSGRGFALRFQKRLKQIAPQMRTLHIDQPIRWGKDDPLEGFTLQNLCLTESQSPITVYDKFKDVTFSVVTPKTLISDHVLLTDIFSLLVMAHYQTNPSDLEKILNAPRLSILLLTQNKQLLAVALINHEGDIEHQSADQIYLGNRRLKGHLIAQSLTFHCAQKQAASHKYARIQRIATHPAIQQQGLGKIFIEKIKAWSKEQQFDHLCASFGATAELLSFWQVNRFSTLRIGSSKDKSSGTHSFIVNLPLSEKAKVLHHEIQAQFHLQLTMQMTRHLQHLESDLISTLLNELAINTYQHPLIDSYCAGNLPYDFVEFHLIALIINSDLSLLDKKQQTLTIQKILQNKSWADICENKQYTGKKQAQYELRNNIKQLTDPIK